MYPVNKGLSTMKDAYFQPNKLMNELSMFLRRSWLCLREGVNKNIKSVMMIEGSGNGEKKIKHHPIPKHIGMMIIWHI